MTETATAHRVAATDTPGWNANGTDFPTARTGLRIAWRPVTYCGSCHDLTDDNNGGKPAFPHAIDDVISTAQSKGAGTRAAIWLTAGSDATTQSTVVGPYDQHTASGSTPAQSAGSSILDGVCLKCHRSASSGVGVDF